MSELTKCNFCTFMEIGLNHPNSRIELERNEMGWSECRVDGKVVVAFMELTDECVC